MRLTTLTFTPTEPLASLTMYHLQITTAITDLEGQPLSSGSLYFTTGQGLLRIRAEFNSHDCRD